MARYIARRLVISAVVLFGITILVYVIINLIPGDPIDFMIPQDSALSAEALEAMRARLGLDKPGPVRYLIWLREAVTGNLGFRFKNFDPVGWTIANHFWPTVILMGAAIGLGTLLGIPLGVVSAVKQYSTLDMVLTTLAFLGISLPAFFAGLVGLYLFALRWPLFPAGGMTSVVGGGGLGDVLHHLILPACILSLNYVATMLRYTRSSMLEVIRQDYVRTARAKGLAESRVILRHALKNTLIPVVTVIGLSLPNLVGGAVFIESIFTWPGMGTLFLDAVNSRDYPLLMGITLVIATAVLLINVLVDIAYAYLNPRIRYD